MTSTITDNEGNEYPVYKFGARWVCEGPKGRFHAHTKRELQRLLRETSGRYDEQSARNAR
jgi:hypothetical protein